MFDESILEQYKVDEDDEAYIFNNPTLYKKNLTPNIKFKEKTSYTIQYTAKQTTGNPRLSVVYTDGSTSEFPSSGFISTSFTKYQITSDANKTIDYISEVYGSTATKGFYIKKNSVQIEQGSTATDYVPHSEQNISFPLAEGQKFYEGSYPDDDEKVHHKRGETTLGEISSLATTTIFGVNCKYQGFVLPNAKSVGRSYDFVCDRVSPANEVFGQYKGYRNGNTLVILTTLDDTVENFNEKIAGATVQYELAEEVTEDFTEEQKTAWKEWKKARTYKNVTHISSEDETPANVGIEYVRDLETVINNLSN